MPIVISNIPMASTMIINNNWHVHKKQLSDCWIRREWNAHVYTVRRPQTKKKLVAASRLLIILSDWQKHMQKRNRRKWSVSASFSSIGVWSALRYSDAYIHKLLLLFWCMYLCVQVSLYSVQSLSSLYFYLSTILFTFSIRHSFLSMRTFASLLRAHFAFKFLEYKFIGKNVDDKKY